MTVPTDDQRRFDSDMITAACGQIPPTTITHSAALRAYHAHENDTPHKRKAAIRQAFDRALEAEQLTSPTISYADADEATVTIEWFSTTVDGTSVRFLRSYEEGDEASYRAVTIGEQEFQPEHIPALIEALQQALLVEEVVN